MKFPRGTLVRKIKGHEFEGFYLTEFVTTKGEIKCVVECYAIGARGLLFIFRPEQLEKVERPSPMTSF